MSLRAPATLPDRALAVPWFTGTAPPGRVACPSQGPRSASRLPPGLCSRRGLLTGASFPFLFSLSVSTFKVPLVVSTHCSSECGHDVLGLWLLHIAVSHNSFSKCLFFFFFYNQKKKNLFFSFSKYLQISFWTPGHGLKHASSLRITAPVHSSWCSFFRPLQPSLP